MKMMINVAMLLIVNQITDSQARINIFIVI